MSKTENKQPTKVKDKFFSSQNLNIFQYLFTTLIKNKIILAIATINTLLIIALPVALMVNSDISMAENLHKFSWIYVGIPFVLSVIHIAAGNMVLFIKTKNNNVDLFLFITPVSNLRILYLKYSAILTSSLYILISQLLVSIIQIIMGVPLVNAILVFFSIFGSLILMSCIWVVVFSFISLHTKYLTALITTITTTFVVLSGFVLPVISQNAFATNTSFDSSKYKKNIVKVFSLDDTGKVIKTNYAIYENPLAHSKRTIKGWSPSKISEYLPFSTLTGFANDALKDVVNKGISKSKIMSMNNKYSINHTEIATKNFDDISNYKNIVLTSINEKTPFEYKDKETLFSDVKSRLLNDEIISAKFKNEAYWSLFINELKKKNVWKGSLSITDKRIISHIFGIDATDSILYTIFDKYNIIYKRYLDGIHKFFESVATKSFADLITYLWSNQNSKLNVFSYQSLGSYEEIYKYHPSITTYDPIKKANEYDLEYIKTILFNINDANGKLTVQALGLDGIYYDINNIAGVFGPNIKTKSDINSYIDTNSTINNLQDIIKKADNSIKKKIETVSFRNNVNNNLILREEISLVNHSKAPINLIYLLSIILITWLLQRQIKYKISKGDVK